jgi:hypothetical protein
VAEALEAFRASGGTDRPPWGHELLSLPIPLALAWLLEACPSVKLLGAESKERLRRETQKGALWRIFIVLHCVACTLVVGAAPHGVRSPAFASSASCKRTR